jgi:predicted DNA binding protein
LRGTADDGTGQFVVEVPTDEDARALVDHLRRAFPDTRLDAKRERERPIDRADGVPAAAVEDLTDRQREALEAAYFGGYFDWPRESTAEEVAESLDIAAPTLHGHLRKAEASLITALFEGDVREQSS